jgi:hypothetical protein
MESTTSLSGKTANAQCTLKSQIKLSGSSINCPGTGWLNGLQGEREIGGLDDWGIGGFEDLKI